MKKHIQNQEYNFNVIANHAISDIFIVLINYFQDIMITIYDNDS